MNTPRAIQALNILILGLGLGLGLGVSIAHGAEAATPAASHAAARLAPAERIPRIVITAKRLTAEQKASMDQAEGKQDIKKLAVAQGMLTLRQAGLSQVRSGLTSVEEILRVVA